MDTTIIVALIGVAGSVAVAVLNHQLAGRVKAQESKIAKLYALSMSEDAFGQLKRLNTGNYGGFWLDPSLTVGLAAEINYFKILGYIIFKKGADTRDLPTGDHPNENLSDYISVTPQGQAFIALREEALKSRLSTLKAAIEAELQAHRDNVEALNTSVPAANGAQARTLGELDTRLKVLEAKERPNRLTVTGAVVGIIGGVFGIIAALMAFPKTVHETQMALNPQPKTEVSRPSDRIDINVRGPALVISFRVDFHNNGSADDVVQAPSVELVAISYKRNGSSSPSHPLVTLVTSKVSDKSGALPTTFETEFILGKDKTREMECEMFALPEGASPRDVFVRSDTTRRRLTVTFRGKTGKLSPVRFYFDLDEDGLRQASTPEGLRIITSSQD